MQPHEAKERKPTAVIDVAKIAARMEGWQLKQPDPENDEWFVITRKTSDGRNLNLGINPLAGYVHFREHEGTANLKCFSISCVGTTSVDFSGDGITFRGNVDYEISSDRQFHTVKLSNASFNDAPITSRDYELKEAS